NNNKAANFRYDADGGWTTERRDDLDGAPKEDAKLISQPDPYDNPRQQDRPAMELKRLFLLEALKAAFLNITFDIHDLIDPIGINATNNHPGDSGPGSQHDLSINGRRRCNDPLLFLPQLNKFLGIPELVTGFNQSHVCIDSKQTIAQRLLKTRHDCHDDVQRHHTDHDTQHRDDGY